MHVQFVLDDANPLIDQPVGFRVGGIPPRAQVVIAATWSSLGQDYASHAVFHASPEGVVDPRNDPSEDGTYTGVDAFGLWWSCERTGQTEGPSPRGPQPIPVTLAARIDGAVVAETTLLRHWLAQGAGGRKVDEAGVVGFIYRPTGPGPFPAVLLVGGSGGGYASPANASLLASHGFVTLTVAYFGVEHLPKALASIPLEYFENTIAWLLKRPAVAGPKVGVYGTSRGGELALLLGATFPDVGAVAAMVPSGRVHGGFGPGVGLGDPAWTHRGEPIVPGTDIPVERTNGPILLVSGKDDQLWPSATLAEIAVERARSRGFAHSITHLSYDDAGHFAGSAPGWPTVTEGTHRLTGQIVRYGGTREGNARAAADSWPRVLAFLTAQA